MADPQAPFDPAYMAFLAQDSAQRHDDAVQARQVAIDNAAATRQLDVERNATFQQTADAQTELARDMATVERRQELRAIVIALIRQRVTAGTVMSTAGVSYGTAKRLVADALLVMAELDVAAPVPAPTAP